ncbi:flavin reductase family protein [Salinirubellus sp. GCM10025818]|uniref:flavin reductase family protein n=1 Tax=Salinirubellus TaxID=2162630 RepID=UPI0030D18166
MTEPEREKETSREFDPTERGLGWTYRTLTSVVVPRPIGWISTTSAEGVDNLAPYSFFNVATTDPPTVLFSPGRRSHAEDGRTDTARNVRDTGEFVVNLVTGEFAEAMNETSATLDPDESEFDHAGLERAASTVVTPPRVAGVAAAMECELHEIQAIGRHELVLGEVVRFHLADRLLTDDDRVDVTEVDAVGRLAASWYDWTDDRFEMERPD